MNLEKIITVGGKPGLFEIITQTRTGAIAQSLIDQKRLSVGAHSSVSILSEIAIYTLSEEVPLKEVFQKIYDKENGEKCSISPKVSKDDLEEYFFEVLPEYDEDRVYVSDIKKIIKWYNILHSKDYFKSVLAQDNTADATDEEE